MDKKNDLAALADRLRDCAATPDPMIVDTKIMEEGAGAGAGAGADD